MWRVRIASTGEGDTRQGEWEREGKRVALAMSDLIFHACPLAMSDLTGLNLSGTLSIRRRLWTRGWLSSMLTPSTGERGNPRQNRVVGERMDEAGARGRGASSSAQFTSRGRAVKRGIVLWPGGCSDFPDVMIVPG